MRGILSRRRSRSAMSLQMIEMKRIEDQRALAATIIQVSISAFLDMMN
jgi:hypothetical protein